MRCWPMMRSGCAVTLLLAVLTACESRSISDSGFRGGGHGGSSPIYHGELTAYDVIGIDPARPISDQDIQKALLAKVSDAERSSGYVAGGISPLGQRKALPTVVDSSAEQFPTIMVSAGKRGLQVELAPTSLIALCQAKVAVIATD